MKRVSYIVLGAGLQGTAAAFDLAVHGGADRITVGDIHEFRARNAIKKIRFLLKAQGARPPRLTPLAVDARRESELYLRIRSHDGVLSALPSALNVGVARASIAARSHYVDLGAHFDVTQHILRLDRPAQKMGVALTPDCGLAPGLCNSLAALVLSQWDRVDEVRIYSGGLPEHPVPPLDHKKVVNFDGLLTSYFGPAFVLRNGQVTQTQGFSDKEDMTFPAPLGTLEAFATGGATSTAPWTFEGRIRTYEHKTLCYPGHFEKIRLLRLMGFLDEQRVSLAGQPVVPKDLFIKLADERLLFPEVRDMSVLRVAARGEKNGQKVGKIFSLLEYEDPRTGFSATQRTGGFPAAAALEQLVTGKVTVKGVAPLERSFPPGPYLDAVQRRGLRIQETALEEPGLLR